jgi:ubiquinone/menaquinone biosynthesis C-methylase UbiE
MHRKARARIERSGIDVEQRLVSSEELFFDEATFDCVVSTFTLCGIEDVRRALGEIHRVLRPEGQFLFLEHGLSPDPSIQKWQRRLNWLERWLADNCRLDRNVRELVENQPCESVNIAEFYLERTPRTHACMYQGVARK